MWEGKYYIFWGGGGYSLTWERGEDGTILPRGEIANTSFGGEYVLALLRRQMGGILVCAGSKWGIIACGKDGIY